MIFIQFLQEFLVNNLIGMAAERRPSLFYMKSKGVLLVAWGKRIYPWLAYNLAFSIKHFNPEIKICIYHDEGFYSQLTPENREYFDLAIPISDDVKFKDGKIDAARIKTSIYDILPFDETLYLDVDAVLLRDIQCIFDDLSKAPGYFYTHVLDVHTIDKGRDIPMMLWAYADDIWNKYSLNDASQLPCTNSSFMYIKKCVESKALFEQVNKNLSDPIPLHSLRMKWGGGQPDELYLNIALAQKGILAKTDSEYIFLGYKHDPRPLYQIAIDHPILSVFGGRNLTKPIYTEWYDRLLIKYHSEHGLRHIFKHHNIVSSKHANVRQQPHLIPDLTGLKELQNALIPIGETKIIDSSKLIQSYRSPEGRTIKVTNWFNCSFLKYRSKIYLVYRIEAKPFCTYTKLAICLLDEDLNPLQDTNILLNLHSNLRGYARGFHVEDPRLFIYKDDLYLSYTDGYQMAQAKIDPESLQATESFYLEKPMAGRTEKNWTFFQENEKLYSVYDINKHSIFEMNGARHSRAFSSEFLHQWKWGELRGGTTPIKIGDRYLSFFHSALDIKYKESKGRQYFMGAYTFSKEAPFSPISVSKEPLISGEVISDIIPRLSNKIFVVFPSGVLRKEKSWIVSFGYNDYQCRYIEIQDSVLDSNLIPVKMEELV